MTSPRLAHRGPLARTLAGLGLVPAIAAVLAASCTTDPVTASVRTLERSGQIAFLCMGPPGDGQLHDLGDCTDATAETPSDFGEDGTLLHLYALVAQETRGELAIVDITALERNVLDQDPSTPGDSFLPVGAQPVDVVATPGGTGLFVAAAEAGRPALYAIDPERIRPCEVDDTRCEEAAPTLSSWPVCTLPSSPGSMVLAYDPPTADGVRTSCDGGRGPLRPGTIEAEGRGRAKLVVTLPETGQVAIVDAQRLLDGAPGELQACPIDVTIDLLDEVPVTAPPAPIDPGPGCAVPAILEPGGGAPFRSIPAGIALAEGRLYVADLGGPLVHVLDVADPCAVRELEPFVLTSYADPERVPVSSRVAVSPGPSPSLSRHLYAIDVEDRSVAVFDASDGAVNRQPLRVGGAANPLVAKDRIRFAAAPAELLVVSRDAPEAAPGSGGIVPFGTLCDPDPAAQVCTNGAATCEPGTLYRTSSDYEDGAGPLTLRGTFAAVALASGQVAVLDIEDFDAPCRGPVVSSALYGCADEGVEGVTSGEPSCGVVVPHAPRSAFYLLSTDEVGRHLPGIQAFPTLALPDGSVLAEDDPSTPRLRATLPSGVAAPLELAVGGEIREVDASTGAIVDDDGPRNTLLVQLADPRVHQVDQEWTITYQGRLPAFVGKTGDVQLGEGTAALVDPSSRFCSGGVQSASALREALAGDPLVAPEDVDALALRRADRVVVTDALYAADSSYWDGASCTFQACLGNYGDRDSPTPARDLLVQEAYDDQLELEPPADPELFACCFPTLVSFEVRPGDEWVVLGAQSGFLHSTIADPETGACRPSCDPDRVLATSRVPTHYGASPPSDGDPTAFASPQFRFAVVVESEAGTALVRDMLFRFVSQGSFVPLRVGLTTEDRPFVTPRTMEYLPVTDEFVVSDGSLEGLLLVPGDLRGDARQYF